MVLLRRVIGDALRARRQGQRRTLREVSTEANVSLGYLSEIERGQKEASSELLAAICDALGAQLSDLLRQVTDTLAVAEEMEGVLVPISDPDGAQTGRAIKLPAQAEPVQSVQPVRSVEPVRSMQPVGRVEPVRRIAGDGNVTVSVRHDTPLRTTLRATRTPAGGVAEFNRAQRDDRERDVVCAA